MLKFLGIIFIAGLLTGCGTLIPKRVEFFQDKVKNFPENSTKERETLKQAAQKAEICSQKTLELVSKSDDTNTIGAARDTVFLTGAVAEFLGPPLRESRAEPAALAEQTRSSRAGLDSRIEKFRQDNNENAGKKIEGTGLLQIPYFLWVAIVGVLFLVGLVVVSVAWSFVKMFAMSNPPVQLGAGAVHLGSAFLKRALNEVVSGGEKFKQLVVKEVSDPTLREKLITLFRVEHERAQSQDTQELVQTMTRKE